MTDTNTEVVPTPVTLADLRAAERLAHDVFRAMVDALSHPGRLITLPAPPEGVPAVLLPVLALADIHTSLAVVGAAGSEHGWSTNGSATPWPSAGRRASMDDGLRGLVHRVSGAPVAQPGDADLVATMRSNELTAPLIDSLRIGSAHAPEHGARVIAAVDALGDGESTDPALDATVSNRGPGASAGRTFRLGGVEAAALRALDRRNDAYPAGIDLWLVDPSGALVGLPRTNRLDVLCQEAQRDDDRTEGAR